VYFCRYFDPVCKLALHQVSDRNVQLDNMERDDVYYSLFPSGCGYQNFLHYAQSIKEGGFRRYDFGEKENMEKYGQRDPPDFDLGNLKGFPIALLSGNYDVLSD